MESGCAGLDNRMPAGLCGVPGGGQASGGGLVNWVSAGLSGGSTRTDPDIGRGEVAPPNPNRNPLGLDSRLIPC